VHVRILLESEIRQLIGPIQALRAVRQAFLQLGRSEATLPGVIGFQLPAGGEVHVKAAHLHGSRYFTIKEAGGFPGNPAKGLPTGSGVIQVFDAETGLLSAILFDNGYLTDLRTGAAGALAADLLAQTTVVQAGILGTGVQARFQLEALLGVRQPGRVVVHGRNEEKARVFAREMGTRYPWLPLEVAGSAAQAVEGSEVLITVTSASEPVVREDWVFKGTHITAIGADSPEKCELMGQVLAKADKVIVDRLDQCLRLGEIHHAVDGGFMATSDIHAELGELAAGLKPGRESDDEITVADLTGLGIQDAAVADFVLSEALRHGRGYDLEI
jgi:ornithine cyclodeaminase/alanine dehydrogenase-like protein (mu-crystallin family)